VPFQIIRRSDMKRLHKFLLFFISLIGLAVSVGIASQFYSIPLITDMIRETLTSSFWLNYVLAGYSAFICLCFFLLLLVALFSPNKSNNLILVKSKGKLQFTKQTIESAARYSFANLDGINFSKVRAKINRKPENTKIYVKLSLSDSSELVGLTENIQNKIESSLRLSLGIDIKSINIKVVEVTANNKVAKTEIDENTVSDPRVI
jgi:uncharacterized alkaline shock family protein YloU